MTDAQRKLVLDNRGLVSYVARQYYKPIPEDVYSEGLLWLSFAAVRFDPRRGVKFNTFAVHWVRAGILRWMWATEGPVKFGGRRQDLHVYWNLTKAEKALGEDASPAALAAFLKVDVDTLERMRVRVRRNDVPLDVPANGLAATLMADGETPEDRVTWAQLEEARRQRIRAALLRLDERSRRIIRARYLGETVPTLDALGKILKLSRERVRQIERDALKKLKVLLGENAQFELAINKNV